VPDPIDASELAELLDRHAAQLQWYASQWTTSPEDCVQEAFIELARQLQRPGKIVPWLYRVVRNKALNAARAERRRTHHETGAGFRERRESLSEDDRLSLPEALAALPLASLARPASRLVARRRPGQPNHETANDPGGASR
jgi:RNA polymerase sigma-70 factor (ECF subfamily)